MKGLMILNVSLNNFYNCENTVKKDCFLNFINSGRGVGKTYSYKKKCIDDFIKYENEFVWIRRNQSDINEITNQSLFFKDMLDNYNINLEIKGNNAFIDDKIAGYFIPLSCASRYKSVPFPNVTNIVFDEYLIGKTDSKRYLRNECFVFLNLISTIVRHRDNCHIYCLGNNDTVDNPYFSYFEIYPINGQRYVRKNDVLLEVFKNENFVNEISQTRFGKLISGTRFGNYAIQNHNLDDTTENVKPFTGTMRFLYGFIIENNNIGMWLDSNNEIYISEKIDPSKKNIIRKINDFNHLKLLFKSSEIHQIKLLRFRLSQSLVYFETMKAKRIFIDNMQDIL